MATSRYVGVSGSKSSPPSAPSAAQGQPSDPKPINTTTRRYVGVATGTAPIVMSPQSDRPGTRKFVGAASLQTTAVGQPATESFTERQARHVKITTWAIVGCISLLGLVIGVFALKGPPGPSLEAINNEKMMKELTDRIVSLQEQCNKLSQTDRDDRQMRVAHDYSIKKLNLEVQSLSSNLDFKKLAAVIAPEKKSRLSSVPEQSIEHDPQPEALPTEPASPTVTENTSDSVKTE